MAVRLKARIVSVTVFLEAQCPFCGRWMEAVHDTCDGSLYLSQPCACLGTVRWEIEPVELELRLRGCRREPAHAVDGTGS